MPAIFVNQPDGRFARFSSVVDQFTHMDMSREEAIDLAQIELGRLTAVAKVDRGVNDDGLTRWHDCLETIEAIHGKAIADEYRAKYPVAQGE